MISRSDVFGKSSVLHCIILNDDFPFHFNSFAGEIIVEDSYRSCHCLRFIERGRSGKTLEFIIGFVKDRERIHRILQECDLILRWNESSVFFRRKSWIRMPGPVQTVRPHIRNIHYTRCPYLDTLSAHTLGTCDVWSIIIEFTVTGGFGGMHFISHLVDTDGRPSSGSSVDIVLWISIGQPVQVIVSFIDQGPCIVHRKDSWTPGENCLGGEFLPHQHFILGAPYDYRRVIAIFVNEFL